MAQSVNIQTQRLLITPFGEKYLTQRYINWLNDPELMCFSEQRHIRHSKESSRSYFLSFEGTANYFWAIEEIKQGLGHIGTINAYVNEKNLLADVGIMIGEKEATNKHYGLEAWGGVCDFLFNDLQLRKITAGALSKNTPMIRLMKNFGMVEDGIRKRHYLLEDIEVDIIHMAIFREQWTS